MRSEFGTDCYITLVYKIISYFFVDWVVVVVIVIVIIVVVIVIVDDDV